jgi:hypothetical protein
MFVSKLKLVKDATELTNSININSTKINTENFENIKEIIESIRKTITSFTTLIKNESKTKSIIGSNTYRNVIKALVYIQEDLSKINALIPANSNTLKDKLNNFIEEIKNAIKSKSSSSYANSITWEQVNIDLNMYLPQSNIN